MKLCLVSIMYICSVRKFSQHTCRSTVPECCMKLAVASFMKDAGSEHPLPHVAVVEKRPEGPTGPSSYVIPHLRNQPKEPSHASKCLACWSFLCLLLHHCSCLVVTLYCFQVHEQEIKQRLISTMRSTFPACQHPRA